MYKFKDYFFNIKTKQLRYWDHKDFYDCYKNTNCYHKKINEYINEKCEFDVRDYSGACDFFDAMIVLNNNPIKMRLWNLSYICRFNSIHKSSKIIKNTLIEESADYCHSQKGKSIFHDKIVFNSIIRYRAHFGSGVNYPYQIGNVFFDNSIFSFRSYYGEEVYVFGVLYLKECDLYTQMIEVTLDNFHFYKCNFVMTNSSHIIFKNCIFEKCNFVKSVLFNNHNYKLLFNKCRFLEMKSYNKITTGDIKYFLQRKQVAS